MGSGNEQSHAGRREYGKERKEEVRQGLVKYSWERESVYTGLFNPSVTLRTPLISFIHAPILKPFGVVIAISGRFNMVYHEP